MSLLRVLVFLLVFGNILLFALAGGWLGGDNGNAGEGESRQPLSPDRIKIVARGDPPPLPAPPVRCLVWNDIPAGQIADVEALAAQHKSLRVSAEKTQEASERFRVYIPPLNGGKTAADKKVAELKSLGIKGFQLEAAPGGDRWGILFGVFDDEASAKNTLDELKKAGVRSAAVGSAPGTPARYRIKTQGIDTAIGAVRKAIGKHEPTDCPAEAPSTSPAAQAAAPSR